MATLSFDHLPKEGQQRQDGVLSFDHLPKDPTRAEALASGAANLGRGVLRGARDLIDGPAYLLPKGIEKAAHAVGLDSVADWAAREAARVSDINKLAEAEYQDGTPGSVAAGVGRVGGNVVTALVPGTGQARATQAVGNLWRTGNRVKSMAAAAGLGATQNAILGTKTDDDSLLQNAAMGVAVAPVAQLVGAGAGRVIQAGRNLLAGKEGRVGQVLQQAGQEMPEALATQIRAGDVTIIPGSVPTTAQAAKNPGISQLARTVKNHGYNPLTAHEASQNAARVAALDELAPGATTTTSIEAAENAGSLIRQQAGELRQILREAIRGAYNDPQLSTATLALPKQEAARATVDAFYPGRAFDSAPIELKRMVARLSNGEPIPLKEFDALRKIVGNRAADLRDTDRTASAAFTSMKALFDDAEEAAITRTANALASGGITADQAQRLRNARFLFKTLKDRYESGPAAALWKTGADGLPARQGAEVSRSFFNSNASQAADIDQFGKLAPGNPEAWGALRRYGIADLIEKAGGPGGTLSLPKLKGWTGRHAKAIEGLYSQEQQRGLRNVETDLARAFEAENLGRSTGSNTAQNLFGSGMLDSRLASVVASIVPRVGPAGLDALRNAGRTRIVGEVGEAMVDPKVAAGSLEVLQRLMSPNSAQRSMRYLPQVAVPAVSSGVNR